MFALIAQRFFTKIPFFTWSGTMSLLKSAHGGNTREAAELLGVSPEQLLDFSANINPLGMPADLK
ncbi:hypothetical protein, partial [Stenotrophomonas maltophilia]|uniref:hypothetical protein n=1 Tax=Stenotrophomonas maltophilia TaxID=40324 RepID=UPI001C9E39B0